MATGSATPTACTDLTHRETEAQRWIGTSKDSRLSPGCSLSLEHLFLPCSFRFQQKCRFLISLTGRNLPFLSCSQNATGHLQSVSKCGYLGSVTCSILGYELRENKGHFSRAQHCVWCILGP